MRPANSNLLQWPQEREREREREREFFMLMSWDMKKEPIQPAAGDKIIERHVHNKSCSVHLAVRCEWKGGFQRNGNGDWLVSRALKQKCQHWVGVCEYGAKWHFISALGSTPSYSRLKYLTLRYMLWRPQIMDIRIKIYAFYKPLKLQLQHLTVTW
jgi:hypothetical protein